MPTVQTAPFTFGSVSAADSAAYGPNGTPAVTLLNGTPCPSCKGPPPTIELGHGSRKWAGCPSCLATVLHGPVKQADDRITLLHDRIGGLEARLRDVGSIVMVCLDVLEVLDQMGDGVCVPTERQTALKADMRRLLAGVMPIPR